MQGHHQGAQAPRPQGAGARRPDGQGKTGCRGSLTVIDLAGHRRGDFTHRHPRKAPGVGGGGHRQDGSRPEWSQPDGERASNWRKNDGSLPQVLHAARQDLGRSYEGSWVNTRQIGLEEPTSPAIHEVRCRRDLRDSEGVSRPRGLLCRLRLQGPV